MQVVRFWYANQTVNISTIWHYSTGFYSLICLFFGMILNGLVIYVFIRNKSLQQPRNYFLINLAITDIGLLVTNNSMHFISSLKKRWIFGQSGCDFYSICGGIFGLTSIATMAVIALTRLKAIKDPLSSLKLTSHCTLVCLICTWLYGSIWIMPPLFGWNRFILEGFGTSCTFDYISQDSFDKKFIFFLIIGGFIFPLSIILISYLYILIRLSERQRQFQTETTTNQRIHYRTSSISKVSVDEYPTPRAIRKALLICALFCFAWGPYAIMSLISLAGFTNLLNPYTTAILAVFTKTAACVNPLIYSLSLAGFKEKIYAYLTCHRIKLETHV